MFACAHPAIEESIRAPLMLQTILGLDAAAIASAFLVSPARDGPAAVPRQGEDPPRRRAVQDPRARGPARAPRASRWTRSTPPSRTAGRKPSPTTRAGATSPTKRSGSAASSPTLAPDEPEAKGLLALMLYAHARRDARRDAAGRYVPLSDQDTRLWDQRGDRGGREAVCAPRARWARRGAFSSKRRFSPSTPPAG